MFFLGSYLPTRLGSDFKYLQEVTEALSAPKSEASKAILHALFENKTLYTSIEDDFNFDHDVYTVQSAYLVF